MNDCYGLGAAIGLGTQLGDQLSRFAWDCSGFSTKSLVSWETAWFWANQKGFDTIVNKAAFALKELMFKLGVQRQTQNRKK